MSALPPQSGHSAVSAGMLPAKAIKAKGRLRRSVTGTGLRGLNDRVPLGGSWGPEDAQRSRWENGYCESFNGKLRHELLNGEIFGSLNEAKVLIEQWRRHYNTVRPHSSLGYRPPAPQAYMPALPHLDGTPAMQ